MSLEQNSRYVKVTFHKSLGVHDNYLSVVNKTHHLESSSVLTCNAHLEELTHIEVCCHQNFSLKTNCLQPAVWNGLIKKTEGEACSKVVGLDSTVFIRGHMDLK